MPLSVVESHVGPQPETGSRSQKLEQSPPRTNQSLLQQHEALSSTPRHSAPGTQCRQRASQARPSATQRSGTAPGPGPVAAGEAHASGFAWDTAAETLELHDSARDRRSNRVSARSPETLTKSKSEYAGVFRSKMPLEMPHARREPIEASDVRGGAAAGRRGVPRDRTPPGLVMPFSKRTRTCSDSGDKIERQ